MYQSLLTPAVRSSIIVTESKAPYPAPMSKPHWIEVLVDCPGAQGLYTYLLPCDLAAQPGDILSVPFGTQQVGAVAIRLLDQLPIDLEPSAIRPVEDVVSRAFFPPTYWDLLQRVADYYCTPLIQVVRVALPPGLLGRSQRRIRLIPNVIPDGASAFLQSAAQQILTLLQAQKQGDYSWHYLQRQVRGANRGLRDLMQRGWVESYLEPPAPMRPKQQQAVTLIDLQHSDDVTPRQREILEVLKRQGGEMWLQELLQTCQVSSSTLKTLVQKGYVVIQPREVLRLETSSSAPDQPKSLIPAQTEAVSTITALKGFAQVLLHGVTGSGKTEVYLQTIAPLLAQGKSALILVPEIGLTPQLTDRFRARFGKSVRVYHSALSDGERYDTWRLMLNGMPQVVIGTRSAIFAPLPNLGVIILDEEHDGSFKQDQPAPCYHARTVAQWRAELINCPLILGSATPSLESWVAAIGDQEIENRMATDQETDRTNRDPTITTPNSKLPPLYLSLPQRIHARPMPPIEVVDMRQELQQGNRSIFSRSLQTALQQMKEQGQQGVLFIHRRGHSTFVSCRSCGYVLDCPHCDVSLTYHQPQIGGYASLRCHYCGYGQTHPQQCPACGSPYLKHFGSGTQRVMQELSLQFPELRCLRFDSDTTRAKGAHRALLTRFAQGDADVLVGTQMLTKGIDLPQVTLVGVMAADGLLHLADFRASERAFQTLIQVAGRAGRGDDPGRVILQTYSPNHSVIEAVKRQDYQAFAESELHYREALHYPPCGRLILLRLSGMDATTVRETAEELAQWLRSHLQRSSNPSSYELLGPAPASIARVSRRYRWQILLKCLPNSPVELPDWGELRSRCPTAISLTIDVDPLHIL
ncbi:MAG: primosomal protein N' [Cyanobacteria bacterium CRU_2_1]|nr:primosomal protein N' [Cyanobacteria bacterium CRU_2_1]